MDNFDLKKYLTENRINEFEREKRTIALDVEGNEIHLNDIVNLVDANITDGDGTPLPGNTFKVIRVNPKTVTIEPTFSIWLRDVRLDSKMVKLA